MNDGLEKQVRESCPYTPLEACPFVSDAYEVQLTVEKHIILQSNENEKIRKRIAELEIENKDLKIQNHMIQHNVCIGCSFNHRQDKEIEDLKTELGRKLDIAIECEDFRLEKKETELTK